MQNCITKLKKQCSKIITLVFSKSLKLLILLYFQRFVNLLNWFYKNIHSKEIEK